eukprot:UN29054
MEFFQLYDEQRKNNFTPPKVSHNGSTSSKIEDSVTKQEYDDLYKNICSKLMAIPLTKEDSCWETRLRFSEKIEKLDFDEIAKKSETVTKWFKQIYPTEMTKTLKYDEYYDNASKLPLYNKVVKKYLDIFCKLLNSNLWSSVHETNLNLLHKYVDFYPTLVTRVIQSIVSKGSILVRKIPWTQLMAKCLECDDLSTLELFTNTKNVYTENDIPILSKLCEKLVETKQENEWIHILGVVRNLVKSIIAYDITKIKVSGLLDSILNNFIDTFNSRRVCADFLRPLIFESVL